MNISWVIIFSALFFMRGLEGLYRKYIKRILDVCCVLVAMLVFCWLFALLAILVRVHLGAPVLFRQPRPGKDEKVFHLYKFRTMTDDRDASGQLLPDTDRLTRFGRWLRATSLDELPELFNILKGDMSLIGPRPLLVKYLPLYNAEQHRRHTVRPGLSGLAQVHGRNAISWEEKFRYDLEYVDSVCFWLDVKILFLSVKALFIHDGIHAADSATAQEFSGTPASAAEGASALTATTEE